MGAIPSVSLPAGRTCRPDCPCFKKCYARKLERIRRSVREAYRRNYELLCCDPETYWREVEAAVMMTAYFRFHVSGDIPDMQYLRKMIEVADRQKHCQILVFTKRFDLVNKYLDEQLSIPGNLHIIFSAWKGMKMENPHSLPEAHVIFRDGTTTASKKAVPCGGNCATCAMTSGGC